MIVALGSGGCLGGSSSSASRPSGYRVCTSRELRTKTFTSACAYRTATGAWTMVQVSPTEVGGLQVRWTVAYAVGNGARTRAGAPRCPNGATCRVVLDRHVTYGDGRHAWMTLAGRTLTCPVGRGDYPDPARACQALAHLRAVLRIKLRIACACPAMIGPAGNATATIDGKHVTVPLDPCTYCGRGTPAAARATTRDLVYLQPYATASGAAASSHRA
jgi:hypothetical protein